MKIILFASSESNVLIVLIHREPVFLQMILDLRIKFVLVVHGSVITRDIRTASIVLSQFDLLICSFNSKN